ncbi:MAG TPA: glutamine-hydrolyzing GMP synthase [Candidatus Andersenbacteria bacterium]|nr:glutamine-hydrolyzing GMP synthase [Candidatus Andersenbacteria bacterium]
MITIIDFGGQLTLLILRRLRELKVEACLIDPSDVARKPPGTLGVIISGGPASVQQQDIEIYRAIESWRVPILGICFGHQLIAKAHGGRLGNSASQVHGEYGAAELTLTSLSLLTKNMATRSAVWMSHGDSVVKLPPGADWRTIGQTESSHHAAITNPTRYLYGVQFHPEASHTEAGSILLKNFAVKICGARQDYSPADLVQDLKKRIHQHVPEGQHVLTACSLGVDSTTVTVLCQQALGAERVHPVFVNTGLLRHEDLALLEKARDWLPGLHIVQAEDFFLTALTGVSDPNEKRRAVGLSFWRVFQQETARLQQQYPIAVYSQGTIAPDAIESAASSDRAAEIKPHHNLVPRPADFPFEPFEPFREFCLFKDEVREVAKSIGVPEEIRTKHPFPGPGLAIRVGGALTPDRIRIAREGDAIWMEELKKTGSYDLVAQAGLEVQNDVSVCQRGDQRHVGWSFVLWAFNTVDFMTAQAARQPEVVDAAWTAISRIGNEVVGVGRGMYGMQDKPPATIEWE